MKIGNRNYQLGTTAPARNHRMIPPPIPLVPPAETPSTKKGDFVKIVIDADHLSVTVEHFNTGTPHQWMTLLKKYATIKGGLNLTTGVAQFRMMRNIIKGDALRVFNNKQAELGNETNVSFDECLMAVTTHVFPLRALVRQKRHMRRYMRKPRDMTSRQHIALIQEMSENLTLYPGGDADSPFDEDELKDIVENTHPASWQWEMVRQDFDPIDHTLDEMMGFFERMESVEEMEAYLHNPDNKSKKPTGTKSNGATKSTENSGATNSAKSSARGNYSNNKKRKNTGEKWCSLHNTKSHDLAECKVLQDQIKRMRSSHASVASGNYGNKTWSRKRNADRKEELNTMVRRVVDERLQNKKHGGASAKGKKKRSLPDSDDELDELVEQQCNVARLKISGDNNSNSSSDSDSDSDSDSASA